jgi:hypothetical protein
MIMKAGYRPPRSPFPTRPWRGMAEMIGNNIEFGLRRMKMIYLKRMIMDKDIEGRTIL